MTENSGHKKTYGICENKCKVEVLPADEVKTIETLVIEKESGKCRLRQEMPEGYTKNNCVIISAMFLPCLDEAEAGVWTMLGEKQLKSDGMERWSWGAEMPRFTDEGKIECTLDLTGMIYTGAKFRITLHRFKE